MKTYYNLYAIAMVLVLTFTSCPSNYTPDEQSGEIPTAERVDDIFVINTNEFGQEYYIFRTNDEKYWKPEGMTIWTVFEQVDEPFTSRTVTMAKPVGYSSEGGGYGIVFCHGEYEIDGKIEPVMLVVMINNNEQYIVGKTIGGVFHDYGWWKKTTHLKQGAGTKNKVTVNRESDGEFHIIINDNFVDSFRDNEFPQLSGGKNGYIVVITPFDSFPSPGIDVYFEEE
ncbi:MAG: hypothetical protein LBU88_07005 [Treponema sp.]|jgi:hypothetical protein|nr:hypothetical protein [Treponema sp.]